MKIALGQINTTVADFTGNTDAICEAARKAQQQGADMVVFPELSVCGYPPLDLLAYRWFIDAQQEAVSRLCRLLPADIAVVVGFAEESPKQTGKPLYNQAAVLYQGRIIHRQAKTLLPSYDVFDEPRYFEPAESRRTFRFKGRTIGLVLCEDIWVAGMGDLLRSYPCDPVSELADQGAELIIGISASPFQKGKQHLRQELIDSICRTRGVDMVYVNAVGANDSLIFDGRSMAARRDTGVHHVCRAFEEDLHIINPDAVSEPPVQRLKVRFLEDLEQALVLGLRDYMRKSGFSRVNIGLSGGIDSALVAVLACRALGPGQVHCIALPSRYSSSHSLEDARTLAENLKAGYEEISIEPMFDAALSSLAESFAGKQPDVTEENIQARIRGVLLMAWSNKMGSLLLTTGNKSEAAVGYCTLYGDMNGAVAVIADVLKTEVFALCRHINEQAGWDLIPRNILEKPPSAELRHDQRDQNSLPPYEQLDEILEMHLIACRSPGEIAEAGHDPQTVARIIKLVETSEYKRRQSALVLKVTAKAFGLGRRIPVVRRIPETELPFR